MDAAASSGRHAVESIAERQAEELRKLADALIQQALAQHSPQRRTGQMGTTKEKDLGAAIMTLAREGSSAALDALREADPRAADEVLAARINAAISSEERAALYRQRGAIASLTDKEAAITYYSRAVSLDPNYAPDWAELGELYADTGSLAEAEKHFKRQLQIGNKLSDVGTVARATNNLGELFRRQNKFKKSENAFKKALTLTEQISDECINAIIYSNMGILYKEWGYLEKSEAAYLRAINLYEKLENTNWLCRCHGFLGDVLKDLGKLEEAADHYQSAISLYEFHSRQTRASGKL